MQIEITILAPQLSEAIYALAKALEGQAVSAPPVSTSTSSTVEQEPKQTVSLEQVRAKLANLSQNGKQAEVKQIITDFGASKLTEIPAERYAEVLARAEKIA
ncbi:MAG: hypothetical protein FH749_07960 [Firmicutes bacterium]|nr:hypothetical protein [Bacillota bacterium]